MPVVGLVRTDICPAPAPSTHMYGDPVLVRGEEERDSAKRERTRRTHARAHPVQFPNACGAHGMTSTAGEEGQRGNTENEY